MDRVVVYEPRRLVREGIAGYLEREGFEVAPCERQVIAHVSAGLTASQIASELRISTKTVENHKQRVFRKLGVQSQSHAVSVALRLGLLGPAREPAWAIGS